MYILKTIQNHGASGVQGFSSRFLFPEKTHLITKWWTFGMSITAYCIKNKINLIYEVNILQDSSLSLCFRPSCSTALAEERSQGKRFCCLELMSSCFYSKWDVVEHRSRLSLCIPWCHIQPIFAGDPPWRVQSSTASEHVASWWRGGGCGIRKRATSKNIALCVLLFPHAVTSESRCWNIKTGCQAATNKRANLFWNVFVYF